MNLKLVPGLHFIKNRKYTYYSKYIKVYVCQIYQNRLRFDNVIIKILWCSVFVPRGTLSVARNCERADLKLFQKS